jgi:hypothetical protein
MNTKLSAAFAAVFCLVAAGQAKATVNVAGNLLWSGDLPGLATDASVTPVVISTSAYRYGVWGFTYSGAAFSGNANPYPGVVWTGPYYGALTPGTGLAATTNYLESNKGGPITMTTPKSESYLGFLMESNYAFNVTLYNGAASLGEITAAQIKSALPVNGAGWINVDVAGGGTYTSAVFSATNPDNEIDLVFEISYGTTSESMTTLTPLTDGAPLPALAGTIPGFAAAILGMFGLRRRSRRV